MAGLHHGRGQVTSEGCRFGAPAWRSRSWPRRALYGLGMDPDAVLGLPYGERRLIVVTNRPAPRAEEVDPPARWQEVILKSPTLAALPFAAGWVVGRDALRKIREMRAQGAEVLPVSLTTAQAFRFPPGHARKNVLYVGHPVDPGSYIPAAEFHRFLFEHKVAEAIRLIRSLGATTVNVRSVKGWNREAALSIGLSLRSRASSRSERGAAGKCRALFCVVARDHYNHDPSALDSAQCPWRSRLDAA